MDEAIAVFLPSGELATSNAAYAALWGVDPGATLGRVTLLDSVRVWQEQTRPNQIWSKARGFFGRIDARQGWGGEVELESGQRLICRFVPLPAGATLAGFARIGEAAQHHPPPARDYAPASEARLGDADVATVQGRA